MANSLDELLISGLTKLKDLEFSDIPTENEIEHIFSNKYINAKNKLLKKLGHSYWKYVNTAAKKIAVIIIALIISFSSLMTVDAVREKVVEFVYKIYNTFTEVSEDTINYSTYIEEYYTIQNIPSQYDNFAVNAYTTSRFSVYWIAQNNQYIMFTQTLTTDTSQFNTENSNPNEVIINNTPCLISKTKTDYFCYWEFDGYRFELIYPLDLGEEFMSEVVGNLVEIDPDELVS